MAKDINKKGVVYYLEQIWIALSAPKPEPVPLTVRDITKLTDEQLDALKPGDAVWKKTGTAIHTYIVTYKDAENGGICLTYAAAGYGETVSYDHSSSGWTYNSTDVKTYGE